MLITSMSSDSFFLEFVFKLVRCSRRRLILSYTKSLSSSTRTLKNICIQKPILICSQCKQTFIWLIKTILGQRITYFFITRMSSHSVDRAGVPFFSLLSLSSFLISGFCILSHSWSCTNSLITIWKGTCELIWIFIGPNRSQSELAEAWTHFKLALSCRIYNHLVFLVSILPWQLLTIISNAYFL